ncbi:predicted protein, partial [Naegleria gruberi]
KNGNGQMGTDELGDILRDLGFDFSTVEVEALQMYLDKNNDGVLSFEEFYEYWVKIASTNELSMIQKRVDLLTEAASSFKVYDTNGNHVLCLDEFEKFYRALYTQRAGASMAEIEQCLKSLDLDTNGVISFQEFIIWLNWLQ